MVVPRGGPERIESDAVTVPRQCSKTTCDRPAVATLTYVYAEQTAVLGPLATYAEPHTYDLCEHHATRLTAPRGWDVVRLDHRIDAPPDDLVALAEAVREHRDSPTPAPASQPAESRVTEIGRRGHLRVLRDS